MQTGGPIWNNATGTNTLKGPGTMLSQSCYPPHYKEVRTSPRWKTARPVEGFDYWENISLHKDKLSLVNLYKTVLPFKYFVY